jgi:hypothetical protein
MGRGRSVYKQPGTRVDGIAPHKEEGFQVSRKVQEKRELARGIGKGKPAKGNNKGLRHNLVLLIYV